MPPGITDADYVVAHREELRGKSRAFVDDFFAATLDPVVLNQVNSQLNTFITSSWLTKQGDFGVLEGMNCHDSCCGLATIDVGVYGTPLIVIKTVPSFSNTIGPLLGTGVVTNGAAASTVMDWVVLPSCNVVSTRAMLPTHFA